MNVFLMFYDTSQNQQEDLAKKLSNFTPFQTCAFSRGKKFELLLSAL